MMMNVGDADFAALVEQELPVLVDCWSPRAEACRHNAPLADELAREQDGRLVVAKLNVEGNPRAVTAWQVKVVPCMILFAKGKRVETFWGVADKAQVLSALRAAGFVE